MIQTGILLCKIIMNCAPQAMPSLSCLALSYFWAARVCTILLSLSLLSLSLHSSRPFIQLSKWPGIYTTSIH